jgi:3-(3-hydroxy-phenyl)propionate hydroxylase
MNPGETREQMLGDEKIRSLIDPWTPRGTYDIRRAAVYQFHAATAETWSKGRVFIAGDAAHQTPPFLGQGMNAGMRDAVNIAWKIPMVLSGLANEALLDSYQSEREAHAHDLVDWAVSIGRLMEHLAATEAAERAGDPPPEMPEQLKSAGYGQGREAPPLRAGVVRLDQVSDTGSTGYMFSQPIVRDSAGKEFHLDELFGEGFAVVGKNQNALNLSAEGKAILKKLDAPLVSLEDLQKVRGHFDNAFENADAIIVRPDRYVFGHTADGVALDDLVSDLGRKLHVM